MSADHAQPTVILEDRDLLVVDKDPGLPTAPLGPNDSKPTLCGMVFEMFPEIAGVSGWREFEGGLLFRLDNPTSGLVMFARSDAAFKRLKRLQETGRVQKTYRAVCLGGPGRAEGQILFPVAHLKKPRRKMAAMAAGAPKRPIRGRWRAAATGYCVTWRAGGLSGMEFHITRALRHQIRVHAAAAGFPIVGDDLYRGPPYRRLMLHAARVFIDELGVSVVSEPGTGFLSPGPGDLVLD